MNDPERDTIMTHNERGFSEPHPRLFRVARDIRIAGDTAQAGRSGGRVPPKRSAFQPTAVSSRTADSQSAQFARQIAGRWLITGGDALPPSLAFILVQTHRGVTAVIRERIVRHVQWRERSRLPATSFTTVSDNRTSRPPVPWAGSDVILSQGHFHLFTNSVSPKRHGQQTAPTSRHGIVGDQHPMREVSHVWIVAAPTAPEVPCALSALQRAPVWIDRGSALVTSQSLQQPWLAGSSDLTGSASAHSLVAKPLAANGIVASLPFSRNADPFRTLSALPPVIARSLRSGSAGLTSSDNWRTVDGARFTEPGARGTPLTFRALGGNPVAGVVATAHSIRRHQSRTGERAEHEARRQWSPASSLLVGSITKPSALVTSATSTAPLMLTLLRTGEDLDSHTWDLGRLSGRSVTVLPEGRKTVDDSAGYSSSFLKVTEHADTTRHTGFVVATHDRLRLIRPVEVPITNLTFPTRKTPRLGESPIDVSRHGSVALTESIAQQPVRIEQFTPSTLSTVTPGWLGMVGATPVAPAAQRTVEVREGTALPLVVRRQRPLPSPATPDSTLSAGESGLALSARVRTATPVVQPLGGMQRPQWTPAELQDLTDQVVRLLDRRIVAFRERRGEA